MRTRQGIRTFDARKVARYERENWEAYYRKRWLRLLSVSVGMVREAFGLSIWRALQAAYLVARAEIAAAPFPDNDIPRAEAYMRRFYTLVKKIHGETFDVGQAARLEVNWWVVHRRLFGQDQNEPLVQALTELYAAVYRVDPAEARQAASHRAQAMVHSDRWVDAGCPPGSPLLGQLEEELFKSYSALRAALDRTGAGPGPAGAESEA